MQQPSITILNIVNPYANGGRCKKVIQDYEAFLTENNINFHTYHTLQHNNLPHIQKLLELYSIEAISVIGGDGTVNLAVNAMPDLTIPVHIIPGGTGNDFAKMIYPKNHLPSIFGLILNPKKTRKVDVWRCNDKRFVNGFGIGFDGAVAHALDGKKYVAQNWKYWIELLKIIASYNSYVMEIEGKKQKHFMVSAANGRVYGGSFNVAPKAEIDDQLLEVVMINKVSKLLRFRYLPKVQKGTHLDLDVVSYTRMKALTIRGEQQMLAHLDGEVIKDSHFLIKLEGAIQVLS